MSAIPVPVLASKAEVETAELSELVRDRPGLVSTLNLTACPERSYAPVATTVCARCPFWLGFGKIDRKTDIGPGNAWVVCAHPVGRRITRIGV